MAGKHVAVVGARGFIGRALCECLGRDVDVEAYDLDRPVWDGHELDTGIREASSVYWLAARINPATANAHPERCGEDRDDFGRFLEALRALPTPPAVVLSSSGGTVYDVAATPPYAESSPLAPVSEYGKAKARLEEDLRASGVPYVIARIANPYGPGQMAGRGQGVIAQWLYEIANGGTPQLMGSLQTRRDYLFIDDLASGLAALRILAGSHTVNLGSGTPTSLGELLAAITEVTGAAVAADVQGARSFDVPHTWLDVAHAAELVGWQATTPLVEGIRRTWEYQLEIAGKIPGPRIVAPVAGTAGSSLEAGVEATVGAMVRATSGAAESEPRLAV